MISLPTIDIPTAIVAVVVALIGNWLKDEFFRWRQKVESSRNKRVEWYKETIHICERVKTTYSLLEKFDSISEDSYKESLADDLEERARDVWEDADSPPTELIGDEPPEELIEEVTSNIQSQFEDVVLPQMLERIREDVSEHFLELRDHFASRPREINEDQFAIGSLITALLIVEVTTGVEPHKQLAKESIVEDTDSIIQTCEQHIRKSQPRYKRLIKRLWE